MRDKENQNGDRANSRYLRATEKIHRFGEESIERKEEDIRRLQERLQKLTSRPNPDQALIKEIRDIARLERELVEDRGQLNAMEEEFSAECGGS